MFDLETGQLVTRVPYQREHDFFLSRMTPQEVATIEDWVNERIDGDEIHTAGWLPGADWSNTPLQPIYEKAARRNSEVAAKCFGLLVYAAFMRRPEDWISGRFELDGREIGSRTYFRPS
ncbi:hypothetical protein HNS30_03310 [Corallococcus exercitus]|uniref:Uncharacterized protein n=1 Tax=Corallococcus exercitus TaxID=2316736 RepID=A0A7Y4JN50_9BACT|nr:hypothetical protein [Corallococcus exercitus]